MAVEIELVAEHCSSVWWFTDNASQWWTRQIKTFCDPCKQISPCKRSLKDCAVSWFAPTHPDMRKREWERGSMVLRKLNHKYSVQVFSWTWKCQYCVVLLCTAACMNQISEKAICPLWGAAHCQVVLMNHLVFVKCTLTSEKMIWSIISIAKHFMKCKCNEDELPNFGLNSCEKVF